MKLCAWLPVGFNPLFFKKKSGCKNSSLSESYEGEFFFLPAACPTHEHRLHGSQNIKCAPFNMCLCRKPCVCTGYVCAGCVCVCVCVCVCTMCLCMMLTYMMCVCIMSLCAMCVCMICMRMKYMCVNDVLVVSMCMIYIRLRYLFQ